MQTVSTEWSSLKYKTLWDKPSIRIKMFVGNEIESYIDSENAVMTGNDALSDISQVLDKNTAYTPYYSSQICSTILNGSYAMSGSVGFVGSALSGSDCTFASYPAITIPFTETQTLLNKMTVTWSTAFNEWATAFNVKLYKDSTLVLAKAVTANTDIASVVTINSTEDEFNKVLIEIVSWSLPSHKARVENIYFGEICDFDSSDIVSFSHEQQGDLLSFEKSKASVNFTLYNNGDWQPFNTESRYYYLQERQKIVIEYGFLFNGAFQMIKCGTFLLSSWQNNSSEHTISFTARDKMEYMDNEFSISGLTFPMTYKALMEEAFSQSGLTADDYSISGTKCLATTTINSTTGVTCGEIIQLCANACNSYHRQNRNGVINITEKDYSALPSSVYTLPRFDILEPEEITTSKELRYVSVNDGVATSTLPKTSGEIQIIENPLIGSNATIALQVANWAKVVLENKNTISVTCRGDLLLDLFDYITVASIYGDLTVYITDIKYTFDGSWTGYIEGRII